MVENLDTLDAAVEGGDFDAAEILRELDLVIKMAKGTKKLHKHRDLTNLNRALEIKAKIYGIMKGELSDGGAGVPVISEALAKAADAIPDCFLSGNGCDDCPYKKAAVSKTAVVL